MVDRLRVITEMFDNPYKNGFNPGPVVRYLVVQAIRSLRIFLNVTARKWSKQPRRSKWRIDHDERKLREGSEGRRRDAKMLPLVISEGVRDIVSHEVRQSIGIDKNIVIIFGLDKGIHHL